MNLQVFAEHLQKTIINLWETKDIETFSLNWDIVENGLKASYPNKAGATLWVKLFKGDTLAHGKEDFIKLDKYYGMLLMNLIKGNFNELDVQVNFS